MKKVSYITVVGAIAIGAIAYLIWQKQKEKAKAEADRKKQQQQQQQPSTGATPGSGAGSTGGSTTAGQPIKMFTAAETAQYLLKGSSGDQVKALQSFLNINATNNANPLTIDGNFGSATENALNSQFSRLSINLDMLNIAGYDPNKQEAVSGWGTSPTFDIIFN